ncbi:MAG: hypothetical protein H6562_19555 [Lewinellaceae bacterium]|nr:hypothetical protein [Lewinellaceae bacterium]
MFNATFMDSQDKTTQKIKFEKITGQQGDTYCIMLVPASLQSGVAGYRYLSFLPRAVWNDTRPEQSSGFTLFLERMPVAEDQQVLQLTEKGSLELVLTHALPADALDRLQQKVDGPLEPLFVRGLRTELIAKDKTGGTASLSRGEFVGQEPGGSISAALNRDQAVALVRIFQGLSPEYGLFLKSVAVFYDPATGEERKLHAEFPMAAVLGKNFLENKLTTPVSRIELKYFDAREGQYLPCPVKVRLRAARARAGSSAVGSVLTGNMVASLAQFTNPGYNKPATLSVVLANSTVYKPYGSMWQIQNMQLATATNQKPKSLPIVDSSESPVWRDIEDSAKIWYRPQIDLVPPDLGQSPDGNNFKFLFRKIGSDLGGNPILEGEVRLKLRFSKSKATQDALSAMGAGRTAVPVHFTHINYHLEIPFLDQSDGSPKTSLIQASEVQTLNPETVMLTFRLTNDWIRACYGVISVEDFQPGRKLLLKISYSFDGYQRTLSTNFAVMAGNKQTGLATLSNARSAPGEIDVFFDSKENKLVLPDGDFIFKDRGPAKKSGTRAAPSAITLNAAIINKYTHLSGTLTPVAQTNKLASLFAQYSYSVSTYVNKTEVEVFFNCALYNAFYVEENNGMENIVGCKEPYQLGKIPFMLYQEIPELRNDYLTVYKSAQSPNQFMALPKKYKITRFADNEELVDPEKAYRPCILLYSNIDAVNLNNSKCFVHITLDPDIPEFVLEALKNDLRSYTAYEPSVQMISEIPQDMTFQWSLPSAITVSSCYAFYRGFQASFSTDISSLLLLKSILENGSLSGSATFRLSDGMMASSLLSADLYQVIGPPGQGPVKVEKNGDKLTLTNMIDKPVAVSKISKYAPGHVHSGDIPVEQNLAKGESLEVSDPDTGMTYCPVYHAAGQASTLQEIRSYIEDISCQVIFLAPFNFPPLGVERIEIYARLKGTGEDQARTLVLEEDAQSGEVNIIMPLTNYLASRIIEYRPLVYMKNQGSPTIHDWQEWSLMDNGNTVQLKSSDLIEQLK